MYPDLQLASPDLGAQTAISGASRNEIAYLGYEAKASRGAPQDAVHWNGLCRIVQNFQAHVRSDIKCEQAISEGGGTWKGRSGVDTYV